jgi:hypothetical protein
MWLRDVYSEYIPNTPVDVELINRPSNLVAKVPEGSSRKARARGNDVAR